MRRGQWVGRIQRVVTPSGPLTTLPECASLLARRVTVREELTRWIRSMDRCSAVREPIGTTNLSCAWASRDARRTSMGMDSSACPMCWHCSLNSAPFVNDTGAGNARCWNRIDLQTIQTKKARRGPFGWFGSVASVDHERDAEESVGSGSLHKVGACGPACHRQGEAVLTGGELAVVEHGNLGARASSTAMRA